LLQRIVFGPLGMTASLVATTPSQTADLAPGHDEKGLPTNNWVFDAFAGAGGVRSTGNDMLKYLKANMTAAPGTAMALAQQPRADVGADSKIGLAWMTTGKYGVVWHNGMTGGYAAFIGFSADRQHGVVLLTNAAASLDDLGLATLVTEAQITAAKKSVTLPVAALDEVVGDYKLPTGLVIHIFRDGDQLVARAEGQPATLCLRPQRFLRQDCADLGHHQARCSRQGDGIGVAPER
jgi:CubicO group peptidase (beta-lactamase class C family)